MGHRLPLGGGQAYAEGAAAPLLGLDLAFAYFTVNPVTFASNPVLVNVQN